MRSLRVPSLAVGCMVALGTPAAAQTSGPTPVLGLARRWVAAPDPASAYSIIPSVELEQRNWRLEGGISHEVISSRSTKTTLAFAGMGVGPKVGPFRTELAADYRTPTPRDPAMDLRTSAQFHLAGAQRGVWLGLGLAQVGSAGTLLRTTGGWWRAPLGTLSFRLDDAVSGARSRTAWVAVLTSDTLTTPPDSMLVRKSAPSIRMRSAVARFVGADGRIDLAVATTLTAAPGAHGRRGTGATGTWWFKPTVALTAGYGAPLEGAMFGDRSAARFGILLRHHPALPRPSTLIERPRASMERNATGEWRIRIPAPGATRVELQGSPTAWEPVTLEKESGGWWEVTLTLPPGRHEIIWRRDGGEWQTLPGLPTAADPELGDVTVVVAGE
ncbi:MAG: glycogen-binding domain-containing protein [Gemmatimonadetes bacterium]|nr:glycogen-binding domain-containing protein [Gemmatimonadota bacterium]